MGWCPICKNEYVEGVTACKDCGCALVNSMEEANRQALTFGTLEELQPALDFLRANGFSSAVLEPSDEEGILELFVARQEHERAQRAVGIFQREQLRAAARSTQEQSLAQEAASQLTQAQILRSSGVYRKSSEKAEEFKSSAYVLLLVGIIGFAAVALVFFGVLPISLNGMNRYLIAGVMGAMFVLFIVMGVVSFKSSRVLLGKAVREDELTGEILGWCRKNLSCARVDEALSGGEAEEEVKYFKRAEYMRAQINNQFMNLDESYLDRLIDEYYQEIYG